MRRTKWRTYTIIIKIGYYQHKDRHKNNAIEYNPRIGLNLDKQSMFKRCGRNLNTPETPLSFVHKTKPQSKFQRNFYAQSSKGSRLRGHIWGWLSYWLKPRSVRASHGERSRVGAHVFSSFSPFSSSHQYSIMITLQLHLMLITSQRPCF